VVTPAPSQDGTVIGAVQQVNCLPYPNGYEFGSSPCNLP